MGTACHEHRSILVLEDEPTILAFGEHVLSGEGHNVVAVGSGVEALTELEQRDFTLLVLDVSVPAPNGWQVLYHAITLNPDQRILMVSGYALDAEARERGALGLIQKPFSGPELVEAVAAAIE